MRSSKTWIGSSVVMMSVLVAQTDQANAAPPRGPNFNGDAYEDLAIGAPSDDDFASNAGSLNLLLGSASGPSAPNGVQLQWSQSGSVPGSPQSGDAFGRSLAWGDFDGNGCDDLAAGVPFENDTATDAGALNVFMGYASDGFDIDESQLWTWSSLSLGTPSANVHLSYALAAGDFDADGVDDLAIGLPGYGSFGIVYVIGGVEDEGLDEVPNETLADFDFDGAFGSALTTGDFNCDGFDDLAVGDPSASDIAATAGAVKVYYGGGDIFFQEDPEIWTQDSDEGFSAIEGATEPGDSFGQTLVAGNFDSDSSGGFSCDDLAIGSPSEDFNGFTTGAVNVIYGGPSGLNTTQSDDIFYNGGSLPGSAETASAGYALTVGEFNSDGHDDLAIGAPLASDGATTFAGAVYLVKGGASGLTTSGLVKLNQSSGNVPGASEPGDLWGTSLGYAKAYGAASSRVLAVGAPSEDSGTGLITQLVMNSSNANFEVRNTSRYWFQDDIEGTLGTDSFGHAFAQVRNKPTTTCN